MGCRAVLTFDKACKPSSLGVYLHWQGDAESVQRILDDVRSYARDPEGDRAYAFARLVEACCSAAGPRAETGVGVGLLRDLDCDNGDNGVYVIGAGWRIVGRKYV